MVAQWLFKKKTTVTQRVTEDVQSAQTRSGQQMSRNEDTHSSSQTRSLGHSQQNVRMSRRCNDPKGDCTCSVQLGRYTQTDVAEPTACTPDDKHTLSSSAHGGRDCCSRAQCTQPGQGSHAPAAARSLTGGSRPGLAVRQSCPGTPQRS